MEALLILGMNRINEGTGAGLCIGSKVFRKNASMVG